MCVSMLTETLRHHAAYCEEYDGDADTSVPDTRWSTNVAAKRSKRNIKGIRAIGKARDEFSDSGYSSQPRDEFSDSGYSSLAAVTASSEETPLTSGRATDNETMNKERIVALEGTRSPPQNVRKLTPRRVEWRPKSEPRKERNKSRSHGVPIVHKIAKSPQKNRASSFPTQVRDGLTLDVNSISLEGRKINYRQMKGGEDNETELSIEGKSREDKDTKVREKGSKRYLSHSVESTTIHQVELTSPKPNTGMDKSTKESRNLSIPAAKKPLSHASAQSTLSVQPAQTRPRNARPTSFHAGVPPLSRYWSPLGLNDTPGTYPSPETLSPLYSPSAPFYSIGEGAIGSSRTQRHSAVYNTSPVIHHDPQLASASEPSHKRGLFYQQHGQHISIPASPPFRNLFDFLVKHPPTPTKSEKSTASSVQRSSKPASRYEQESKSSRPSSSDIESDRQISHPKDRMSSKRPSSRVYYGEIDVKSTDQPTASSSESSINTIGPMAFKEPAEIDLLYCPFCSARLTSVLDLQNHVRAAHYHEQTLVCRKPARDKIYQDLLNLETHRKRAHKIMDDHTERRDSDNSDDTLCDCGAWTSHYGQNCVLRLVKAQHRSEEASPNLRSRLSILWTRNMALNVYGNLQSLLEDPIADGKTRIRWNCVCA